jgi:hypothetical protein
VEPLERLPVAFMEPVDSLTLMASVKTLAEPCTAPPKSLVLIAAPDTLAEDETLPAASLSRIPAEVTVPVPEAVAEDSLTLVARVDTVATPEDVASPYKTQTFGSSQTVLSREKASVSIDPNRSSCSSVKGPQTSAGIFKPK